MLDFIGRMFFGLQAFLRTGLGRMVVLLIAPVVAFFGLIFELIGLVENYFNAMIDQAALVSDQGSSLGVGTYLGLANHFFPLDLIFEYSTVLIALWLLSLVYRAIKSFIPTLS